jgi:NAD(P)-dependent dehydrogenase (short-subunit alcohol dehydrogenase family)
MPPRLLPASYGFVDTLARYPTLWTFNSGALHNISNQYAAMPSVHCCWALWCACALVPRVRPMWGKALAVAYHAASWSGAEALAKAAYDEFGRVDVLVNNAGIAAAGAVHEMPVSLWDRVIAVHLRGTFLMTRAVLPEMYARNSGRIINTANIGRKPSQEPAPLVEPEAPAVEYPRAPRTQPALPIPPVEAAAPAAGKA